MNKTFRRIWLWGFISSLLFYACPSMAAYFLTPGETGAQFLTLPISARTVALGSGISGLGGDIHGYEANPASLSTLRENQLTLTRAELFQETSLTSFALGLEPIRSIGFALQYRRFGMTDIQRDADGFGLPEELKMSDNGFSLGTSYLFRKRVSFGYSAEYMRRNLDRYFATAFMHSVGMQFLFSGGRQVIGISAQNLGRPAKFIQSDEPMPIVFRLGGSHRFGTLAVGRPALIPQSRFAGVWELAQYRDIKRPSGSLGAEWKIYSVLDIRAGIQYLQEDVRVTGGLGVRWGAYQIDYAVQNNSTIGIAHTVSFLIRWERDLFDD